MRTTRIYLPLISVVLSVGLTLAVAQEPLDEPAASEARPTPTATPGSVYPDIESLREPGSSAKLFPPEPTATPDPALNAGRGGGRGRGRRGGGAGGQQGRKSGRHRDAMVTQADADPLQVRVAFRRAKTAVMSRDPGLAGLLQQADQAGTDPEKRAYLKQYYTRLYAEVVKVDPSPELKKHVDTLKLVSRQRYEPRRREVGGEEDMVLGRAAVDGAVDAAGNLNLSDVGCKEVTCPEQVFAASSASQTVGAID